MSKNKILINGQEVRIKNVDGEQYFCITDIAKSGKGAPTQIILNYLRNKNTILFLGMWEVMHNQNFKQLEFEVIKNETGLNNFTLSVGQWIKQTDAKGMKVFRGKYGGTYCHKDIVLHFTTWFSVPFYLYLIQEFQYLSLQNKKSLEWHLSKITNNIEETRNLLDTIPMQKDDLNRLKKK